MWTITSTALMTACIIFIAQGATAGIGVKKGTDVRKRKLVNFILAALTGIVGVYIMLFVQ